MLAGFGLESRVIDRTALGDHLNGMETPALGGIHHSTDAHLVPSDFVHGLAHRAQALGAEVLTSTRVRGFDIGDGRVRGVETDNGAIRADEVVLAAGSWSPSLIKGLNVRLPIQPAKGYSVTYTEATRQPPTPTLLAESRVFLTPMRGALRLAGTLELAGMDLSVNPRRVGAIIRAADRYLPELAIANAPHGEVWSGLRPATPDGLPVIGPRPPLQQPHHRLRPFNDWLYDRARQRASDGTDGHWRSPIHGPQPPGSLALLLTRSPELCQAIRRLP